MCSFIDCSVISDDLNVSYQVLENANTPSRFYSNNQEMTYLNGTIWAVAAPGNLFSTNAAEVVNVTNGEQLSKKHYVSFVCCLL